jgi:hypothetical protein
LERIERYIHRSGKESERRSVILMTLERVANNKMYTALYHYEFRIREMKTGH